jgi:hypothetical protein
VTLSKQSEEVGRYSEGDGEANLVADGSVASNSAGANPPSLSRTGHAVASLSERVEKLREVLEPVALRASFHVRSGVTLAVIIALTGLGFGVFKCFNVLRPFVPHTSIALGLYGLALYFFRSKKSRKTLSEEDVLRFYQRPRYWSYIVLASAALIFTLCSALLVPEREKPAVVEKKKPLPAPMLIPEPVVKPPPSPKTVEFPALTITGVLLNGEKSSAIINGDTMHLGEYIEGVKLVDVVSEGVVVELEDSKKAFPLESASGQRVKGVPANQKLSPRR